MKKNLFLALFFCATLPFSLFSQSVPFPTGSINTNELEPWGYDQLGTNWDTSPYLPFIYRNFRMRLMPPNDVNWNSSNNTWSFDPTEKYPIIIFFHGRGESGKYVNGHTQYDNNNQLKHGGQRHRDAVLSGEFPGFLLYAQDVTTGNVKTILDKLMTMLPIDRDRVYVHGLSDGGVKSWDFAIEYPNTVAAAFPMSAASANAQINAMLYKPFRQSQGDRDQNPAPHWSQQIVDWFNTNGGHLEYFLLEGVGHGTWNYMYNRSDFFSWFLEQKLNRILVRYDRNEICPEDPINVDMGFTPGFDAYEWRKDGILIPGQTSYKIIATSFGSYTGRYRENGIWSDWSDPVVVKTKLPTNTPPITANGLKSVVIPAPDGSTTAELTLPEGYESYSWFNAANDQLVGSEQVLSNAPVGAYYARVVELNGCSSVNSPNFQVLSANGPNAPSGVSGFLGYANSQTEIKLSWSDEPNPSHNETGFEIYRASEEEGPFSLIAITAADQLGYTDSNLTPNKSYYYLLRPVNQFTSGPETAVIHVMTLVDDMAPTAPTNLTKTGASSTSVSLTWGPSTDNVGVFKYDVYKDGVRVLATDNLSATVYNLVENQTYNFTVKARDVTGNSSTESNLQVIKAEISGLAYKYYSGTWSSLPDFNSLTPEYTGHSSNVDLGERSSNSRYAFYWEGMINIPVAGNYTFETRSDDGSKVYIGGYGDQYEVVDNDGRHSSRYREGTKNFAQPGRYKIVITYFMNTGSGNRMELYWKNTAHGVTSSRLPIPDSAFEPPISTLSLPVAPTNLSATTISFKQINLAWSDNSNNESGFRIYRSLSNGGPFSPIGSVSANTASYQDLSVNPGTQYFYRITAIGVNGESKLSNEVARGLDYTYYEGAFTNLSQIAGLTPVKVGSSSYFDLGVRDRNINYVITWTGKIYIETAGTYTFYASSNDGSTIHIDNTLVVANDFDRNSMTELSGTRSLTVGWHDINVKFRQRTGSSYGLTISYAGPGISKRQINAGNSQALLYGTEINATTLPLPPAPLVPTNLATTMVTPFSAALSWDDNAFDETSYQLWRSFQTENNFVLFKSLPAGTTSYADADLFANATYYYEVKAIGPGGTSTSNRLTVATSNNDPAVAAIANFAVKFNTSKVLDLVSTDGDNDPVAFSVTGLPAFGALVDNGDGTGTLTFDPLVEHLGDYNITVTATDSHAGIGTADFVLTVTDKDIPLISAAGSVSLAEGENTEVVVSASSDFGAENLTWSFDGLPEFAASAINNVSGTCTIALNPAFVHSGTWEVTLTVTDPIGSSASTILTINVSDVNPNQKFSVNIVSSSSGTGVWNNMTGTTLNSLRDGSGTTTSVGVQFITPGWNTWTDGATTGNNSGVFPDNVMRDYYYFGIFGAPDPVSIQINGLDPSRMYNFGFLGSSIWPNVPDNGSTVYAINGSSVSMRVQGNTQNLAMLNGVTPQPDGSVTMTMSKANGSAAGFLNAFTFESMYDMGTTPAPVRDLTAAFASNVIQLSWVDAPFNEDGFDVYKSTSEFGTYTKINASLVAANSVNYVDANIEDGQTYYYKVKSVNGFGESAFSNTAEIMVPNVAPQIQIIGDLTMPADNFAIVNFTTSPDATLSFTNLPSFSFESPISASSYDILFFPSSDDFGVHEFTVTATDGTGLVTTQNVSVSVEETTLYKINVNFSQNSNSGQPWNNTAKAPAINDTFNNLVNDSNVGSGVSMQLMTNFGGVYNQGASTGNDSGVVPDNVLQEYYWFGAFGAPNQTQIRFSGLKTTEKYKFKFVGSSVFDQESDNGSTSYAIGGQSVSLNAKGNTSNFAIIEDVITNANGQVTVTLTKDGSAFAGYINAIIIEAYSVDLGDINPSNLRASGYSSNQVFLEWNDNSPVESGFEIYRSSNGQVGSYALVGTTGTDVSNFIDTVPVGGAQLYYYQVRAVNTDGFSDYTNVATSGAISFTVLVNINGQAQYDAPAPWNNISQFGLGGDIFYGFKDENGNETGFRMRVETPLEGDNNWGMDTGNNSGLFPDNVLNSFWFNDAYFPVGEFVMDGLDQTYTYNFGFMGSIDVNLNVRTSFTVNGVSVENRNDGNISNVSFVRNVKPTENSEVIFSVMEAPGSPWSIWNAMVIEGYPSGGKANNSGRGGSTVTGNMKEVRYGEGEKIVTIYPNPVQQRLNVRSEDSKIGEVRYSITDLFGREIQSGAWFSNTINSENSIDIVAPSAMYHLRLMYPDGSVIMKKFIKQ